jgi:hypothetical protein
VSAHGPPRTVAGQKRKLEVLRVPREQAGQEAAPAVPSFGVSLLPLKPLPSKNLGLVPSSIDVSYPSSDEGSGDDVDEEVLHAELGTKLTFEHNGTVLSLSTAADLAAWREERRQNWPKRDRIEAKNAEKRKVGRERMRLLSTASSRAPGHESKLKTRYFAPAAVDERRPQIIGVNVSADQLQDADSGNSRRHGTALEKAKAEWVKQEAKLSAPQKHVSSTQASLDKEQARVGSHDMVQPVLNAEVAAQKPESDDEQNELSSILSASSALSDDSDDAEVCDTDSDGPPEEAESKEVSTAALPLRPVCKYFAASGYCRDGDMCRFQHVMTPQAAAIKNERPVQRPRKDLLADNGETMKRKSLYIRLLEQQEEEEDRLALKVIKHLGRSGLFDSE